jgi:DNA repair protein RadC
MKIYDLKLTHQLVCEGRAEPLNSAARAVEYMAGAFDEYPEQEQFFVLLLNRKNYAKGRQRITIGTATACLAHPREVFRAAVLGSASGLICVHNHPSGDPAPSAPDLHVTRQLREAAKAVDIELMDHIIIGSAASDPAAKGYFSFREAGLI